MRVWLGVLNAYGSVRWSIEVDIKSVIAPKFENNVILASTERLIMNTRPKIPANARNLNVCIIVPTGPGKTHFWRTPSCSKLIPRMSLSIQNPASSPKGTFCKGRV